VLEGRSTVRRSFTSARNPPRRSQLEC